jgi:hypothetical protein
MSDRPFERAVRDWLEDGSDRTPPAAVNAVLLAVKTTPQERDLWIPRRFSLMSMTMRLGAGIAVVAIAVAAIYLIGPRLGVGGPDTTAAPTPTAAATAAPTTTMIDRAAKGGYTLTVPAAWHESETAYGVYFSTPTPLTSASVVEGAVEAGTNPANYLMNFDAGASGTTRVEGTDVGGLADSLKAFYRSIVGADLGAQTSVTVDGEPGMVVEHTGSNPGQFYIDCVVIHGDRAYDIGIIAAPEAAAEARAALAALLASVAWSN